MRWDDEAELLREDDDDWNDQLASEQRAGDLGNVVLVGQTKKVTTYPTSAGSFYGIVPQVLGGTEVEGGAGSLTPSPGSPLIYALNLGGSIPAAGTYVICTFVDSRWTFRYD